MSSWLRWRRAPSWWLCSMVWWCAQLWESWLSHLSGSVIVSKSGQPFFSGIPHIGGCRGKNFLDFQFSWSAWLLVPPEIINSHIGFRFFLKLVYWPYLIRLLLFLDWSFGLVHNQRQNSSLLEEGLGRLLRLDDHFWCLRRRRGRSRGLWRWGSVTLWLLRPM